LAKFLPIIRDSPVYPIIYDAEDRVLSMPPIINSERQSYLSLQQASVAEPAAPGCGRLQNWTGHQEHLHRHGRRRLDQAVRDAASSSSGVAFADPPVLVRLSDIVACIMSTMFSEYAETPYVIEPVRINFADGTSRVTPDLAPRRTTASAAYINSVTGFAPALPSAQVADLLVRMSLGATVSAEDADVLLVDVPPTRPDILHECDIMEDAAVAYGFNKIAKTFPRAITVGAPLPLNKLADIVRKECAQAGWVEVLPYILCAHAENFAWLNRPDPGNLAIALANPKTVEYQVVRTSLLPGLLKTLRENKKLPLPVRIFEVSDVAVQDASEERKARNERKVAGLWCNKTAGFEVVHGLLDRIMQILGVAFIERKESAAATGYYIQETTSAWAP
jgi:phenylalanyl-tRNA synthetase beta chain